VPPFWISIAVLSLAQGAVVATPRALGAPTLRATSGGDGAAPASASARTAATLARLKARWWAVVPPASVLVFVVVTSGAQRASAHALTYVALVGVPALALLALAWRAPRALPAVGATVAALFALAWADRGGLAGEAAALGLTALSCVALGTLLAWVTPPRWLAAGIVAMAVADTALVVADLLQKPNNALNAAHPAVGLPRLQSAVFGRAVMGYGDLFVAAALGALLAIAAGRSLQRRAAALTALLAVSFDLLFFFVDELPATVPVALTLLLLAVWRRPVFAQRPPAPAWAGPARAARKRWALPPPPRAPDPGPAGPADRSRAAR
jgi:hypothetical protein